MIVDQLLRSRTPLELLQFRHLPPMTQLTMWSWTAYDLHLHRLGAFL